MRHHLYCARRVLTRPRQSTLCSEFVCSSTLRRDRGNPAKISAHAPFGSADVRPDFGRNDPEWVSPGCHPPSSTRHPPVIHPWSARHPQVAQGVHREIHRLVPLSPHRASRVVSPVQRAAVHGADGQRRSGGRTMGHDVVGQGPHTCDRITACLLQTLTRPPHQGWPGRLVLRPADRKKKHR